MLHRGWPTDNQPPPGTSEDRQVHDWQPNRLQVKNEKYSLMRWELTFADNCPNWPQVNYYIDRYIYRETGFGRYRAGSIYLGPACIHGNLAVTCPFFSLQPPKQYKQCQKPVPIDTKSTLRYFFPYCFSWGHDQPWWYIVNSVWKLVGYKTVLYKMVKFFNHDGLDKKNLFKNAFVMGQRDLETQQLNIWLLF